MKKSAHIDLGLIRKSTTHKNPITKSAIAKNTKTKNTRPKNNRFLVKRLSLAVTMLSLAACSSKQEDVLFVQNTDECASRTTMSASECEAAYKKAQAEAQRTAPRYDSRARCEIDFGDEQCYRQPNSSLFSPFMAGFLISQLMSSSTGHYNPGFHYRNNYGGRRDQIMTADGYTLGRAGQTSYKVNREAIKPKPAPKRTISRGGFGSKAAAKSNWGGGRTSGGWGG